MCELDVMRMIVDVRRVLEWSCRSMRWLPRKISQLVAKMMGLSIQSVRCSPEPAAD